MTNDTARKAIAFDWLVQSGANIAYSKDGDDCWLHWPYDPNDEEGSSFNQKGKFDSPLAAVEAAMKEKKAKPEMYVIWKKEDERKGWYDHCMVFWRSNSAGYTNTLDQAGRYTLEEAIRKTSGSNGEIKMISEERAIAASKTITIVMRGDLKGPRKRITKTHKRILADMAHASNCESKTGAPCDCDDEAGE